jgi:predicted RNase H-like nuclease (RuvC/YqgF family)
MTNEEIDKILHAAHDALFSHGFARESHDLDLATQEIKRLKNELAASQAECAELRSKLDAVLKLTSLSFKYTGGKKP